MDSLPNFAYASSYLYLKNFSRKIDGTISFKTTNDTKLTKAILESSYRVLQVTSLAYF